MRPALTMRDGGAVLGLGCAPIGNLYHRMDDETARATVEAAWDAGIRYFDTAPHYGLGLSERRLGDALAGRVRASYQISTKVGRLLVPHPHPTESDLTAGGFDVPGNLTRQRDYSRDGVRRSIEESLQRLRTDRVDIAYVHDPEDFMEQATAEAVPALIELREEGVVGAVGVGMNCVDPLRRFVRESGVDVVMVAGRWTLLDRTAAPLLDDAERLGVSVVVAAPFNSGLLATDSPGEGSTFDYLPASPELITRAVRLAAITAEGGTTLPAAALHFGSRHPAVDAVVAGLGSPQEVRIAGANWRTEVPEQVWARVALLTKG